MEAQTKEKGQVSISKDCPASHKINNAIGTAVHEGT